MGVENHQPTKSLIYGEEERHETRQQVIATIHDKLALLKTYDMPEASTIERVQLLSTPRQPISSRLLTKLGLSKPQAVVKDEHPKLPIIIEALKYRPPEIGYPSDCSYSEIRYGYMQVMDTTRGYLFSESESEQEETINPRGRYVLVEDGSLYREASPYEKVDGEILGLTASASLRGSRFRFRNEEDSFANRGRIGILDNQQRDLIQFPTEVLELNARYLDSLIELEA